MFQKNTPIILAYFYLITNIVFCDTPCTDCTPCAFKGYRCIQAICPTGKVCCRSPNYCCDPQSSKTQTIDQSENDSTNRNIIIGSVVGAVALIILIGIVTFSCLYVNSEKFRNKVRSCFNSKKTKKDNEKNLENERKKNYLKKRNSHKYVYNAEPEQTDNKIDYYATTMANFGESHNPRRRETFYLEAVLDDVNNYKEQLNKEEQNNGIDLNGYKNYNLTDTNDLDNYNK